MGNMPALATALRFPRRAVHEGLAPLGRNLASSLVAVGAALSRMWERSRQRGDLRSLDEHMLSDIGLTREVAERESRLPFWKLRQ